MVKYLNKDGYAFCVLAAVFGLVLTELVYVYLYSWYSGNNEVYKYISPIVELLAIGVIVMFCSEKTLITGIKIGILINIGYKLICRGNQTVLAYTSKSEFLEMLLITILVVEMLALVLSMFVSIFYKYLWSALVVIIFLTRLYCKDQDITFIGAQYISYHHVDTILQFFMIMIESYIENPQRTDKDFIGREIKVTTLDSR